MTDDIKDRLTQLMANPVHMALTPQEAESMRASIEALEAQLADATARVREAEGWRLVPLEPTSQQHIAAMEFALAHMASYGVTSLSPFSDYPPLRETTAGMYRSMVSAAPSISSLPAVIGKDTK